MRSDSSTTALLVVDVQNDFCDPDGVCGQAGYPVRDTWPAARRAQTLLEGARGAGVHVVHLRLRVDWETEGRLWLDQLLRLRQPGLCTPQSTGEAPWPGLEALAGEPVVFKRRFSGFWRTGLTEALQHQGIDQVVVCGVATNICVQATACDAFMDGFAVTVAGDASGGYSAAGHDAALELLELAYGRVRPTEEILTAWAPAAVAS